MEMVFVVVIGASLAGLVRYVLPGREWYGLLVLPVLGAVVSAVVWAGLTWAGMPFDGGWIWTITFAVTVALAVALALWLPRQRERADEHYFEELARP